MSSYYTPPPQVVDGDVAYAADVNDINNEANTAFTLVEADIDAQEATVQAWAVVAQGWASADQGVLNTNPSSDYSALAYALEAKGWVLADGVAGPYFEADGSTVIAKGAKDYASDSSITASASLSYSELAEEWAVNPEDTPITGYPGQYSALHWSAKAEAFYNSAISANNTIVAGDNIDVTATPNGGGGQDFEVALEDSPALAGTPTAPTATAGTNTTQVATTAFVRTEIGEVSGERTWAGGLSRSFGVTYTNNTDLDMEVMVSAYIDSGDNLAVYVGGIYIASMNITITGGAVSAPISFTVPPGQTYLLDDTGTPTLLRWAELSG